ncbi:MAG: triose-phosphate isomerase [Bacteroidetes bacterium]|nr:triose-phosphate isomerase [Bacteroidota bacterium]
MSKIIVAGNWKMNTTLQEGISLIQDLKKLHDCGHSEKTEIIIFPPFTHLNEFSKELTDCCIQLGAQNLHQEEKGAYTGEISANMIKSIGCDYVLVGHSERRQYAKETNALLADKIKIALGTDLTPVYCCGESLKEREGEMHFKIIEKQIAEGLFHLSHDMILKVIIAYEPIWAIGTGKTASPEQAQEIHAFIRKLLSSKYGNEISEKIRILYGGSVNASNAKDLFSQPDIDGGLVGGASLKPPDFNTIINSA